MFKEIILLWEAGVRRAEIPKVSAYVGFRGDNQNWLAEFIQLWKSDIKLENPKPLIDFINNRGNMPEQL